MVNLTGIMLLVLPAAWIKLSGGCSKSWKSLFCCIIPLCAQFHISLRIPLTDCLWNRSFFLYQILIQNDMTCRMGKSKTESEFFGFYIFQRIVYQPLALPHFNTSKTVQCIVNAMSCKRFIIDLSSTPCNFKNPYSFKSN